MARHSAPSEKGDVRIAFTAPAATENGHRPRYRHAATDGQDRSGTTRAAAAGNGARHLAPGQFGPAESRDTAPIDGPAIDTARTVREIAYARTAFVPGFGADVDLMSALPFSPVRSSVETMPPPLVTDRPAEEAPVDDHAVDDHVVADVPAGSPAIEHPANGAVPATNGHVRPAALYPATHLPVRAPASRLDPATRPLPRTDSGPEQRARLDSLDLRASDLQVLEPRRARRSRRRYPRVLGLVLLWRLSRRRLTGAAWLISVAVISVLVALAMRAFVVQSFWIPSGSMEPTLHGCSGCKNDRVLVDKLSYKLHSIGRGDVIVFSRPAGVPESDSFLIKRVIGLSGEQISAHDGSVIVDGRTLVEPYIEPTCGGTQDFGPVTVPSGDIFVMGDNRCGSLDSRFFGPIQKSTVVGRAFIRIWPLNRLHWL